MKEIKLTQNQFAQVDDEDFEYLSQFKWYAMKKANTFYAVRADNTSGKHKTLWMHRVIMNTPSHLDIDHIDRNGLNNCRANLRNCTRGVNTQNSEGRGEIVYKGVSYFKQNGKRYIRATYGENGKCIHIGYFKTMEEAARAYDKKVLEIYGKNAYTNFK